MSFHRLSTDICIAGGGIAGVCAAIAAARQGAKVVLIQNRSVLGGNASSEIRMHIVGADCHGMRPGARESGLLEELRLEDAVRNPQRSLALWDLLLYEKVRNESRITLLLDTDCIGCRTETLGDRLRIASLRASRPQTEDEFEIEAQFFADCTGDGRLGFEAGAEFRVGREGRAEYGEPLAREVPDAQTLGSSILFTAKRHPTPQPFLAPHWIRRFERHEFAHRPIQSYEYGYWWAEWGGQLDTIKDNGAIRHELLRIALGIWDYVKNSGDHPDSENWALDWVGALPGKRESRRFLGRHVLTQQDLEASRIFDDQVAYGGWWLDLHPPSGVDAVGEAPCVHHHLPGLYSIPLRALFSRNVGNLFFAGRNISATHVAFASTRVMGTCAAIGQAVGTAMAQAAREKLAQGGDLLDPSRMGRLQQTLLKEDAFLLGVVNRDDEDLARRAEVRTSPPAGPAPKDRGERYGRDIRKEWGTWADDLPGGWGDLELPGWMELHLAERALVSEIHLTFDTGLHRELILSASDKLTSQTVRGPQPETVKEFALLLDGRVVHQETNNYLRKRIIRLPSPISTRTLRIELHATHGAPTGRLFEVRIYG